MSPESAAALADFQLPFEGRCCHFYLDTASADIGGPFATIGVGHMVPDEAAAVKLPMRWSNGAPATPEQILADFRRVKEAPGGRVASFYSRLCECVMMDADSDALHLADIAGAERIVAQYFPSEPTWPEPAKMAATDMEFNVGIGTLLLQFPHFDAALQENPPNFTRAAAECQIQGAGDAWTRRNAQHVLWLQEAATAVQATPSGASS
jgi:hypothetical protein